MPVKIATASLGDLLRTPDRFLRSTHLERDVSDPRALDDYCLTGFGLDCLANVAEGLSKRSSRRAWRFTGDYGSGKSSFALLLTRLAQSARVTIPTTLKGTIEKRCPEFKKRQFVPLIVVGAREPMGRSIIRRLKSLIEEDFPRALSKTLLKRLTLAASREMLADADVLQILKETNSELMTKRETEGLLLIMDEAGKFLEHAAFHPESQDVMLMQGLAEMACRSGDAPFVLVCLFHVAFGSYADHLTPSAQREWSKVAERFQEVVFSQPLEQSAALVAASLRVDTRRIPNHLIAEGERTMTKAYEWRWFGPGSSRKSHAILAAELFPLDPLLLPVAVRIFHRFAQNERSLFSFLFGYERFGLRAFAMRPLTEARWLRLPDLFDYVRTNLGPQLVRSSYRNHWPAIEAVVDASEELPPISIDALKVIGLLNLLGSSEGESIHPSEEVICWAVGGGDPSSHSKVKKVLKELVDSHRIFYRGQGRGYYLWPYSSVDLEKAFEAARVAVPDVASMAETVNQLLDHRPIVARRHYIETGTLRFFDVAFIPAVNLAEALKQKDKPADADGKILVALCEDASERKKTLQVAGSTKTPSDSLTFIAVTRPLGQLRGLALEALRWEWVSTHTPELNGDKYAREEVSRQQSHSRELLNRRLSEYVGLHRFSGTNTLDWFFAGEKIVVGAQGRDLVQVLSQKCDEFFKAKSPHVINELINRHSLSSAAAGARMRLIEALLTKANLPQLGIPIGSHPPEMSMYLSVLFAAKLHEQEGNEWNLLIPTESKHDPCNMRHVFKYLRECLSANGEERISIPSLFAGLAQPPYGLRRGLIPLLLAVFYSANAHELAFYERGNFVPNVDADMFLRLTKVPELFEVQLCHIEGLRAEILNDLCAALALPAPEAKKTRLVEIVRALCMFAATLPEYTTRTKKLSNEAIAVRDILRSAREPVKLILYQLPQALGMAPFSAASKLSRREAQEYVSNLNRVLRELKDAYGTMLQSLEARLHILFRYEGLPLDQARQQLIARASRLKPHLREPKMVTFCGRLADSALKGAEWIESLGSALTDQPPRSWRDAHDAVFETEITELSARFVRIESLHLGKLTGDKAAHSVRVSITRSDGTEIAEVIDIHAGNRIRFDEVQKDIARVIEKGGATALAAATVELERCLSRKKL